MIRVLIFFLFINISLAQNLPKLGKDSLLDIGCWNTEWFGDTSNGPTDENTQYNNVKKVLQQTDIDVWGLCEMSNTLTFSNLANELSSIYGAINSTFSATQKMCLFYKKNMFNPLPALTYNLTLNSTQNFYFASRPPLQVALQTKGGNKTDTIYVLVVHLKAMSDLDSYNRRVSSSAFLKTYVEQNFAGKKFFIIGDWNDMINISTYNNSVSPFKNFIDSKYLFISKVLEDAGKRSYAFSASFLDHILNGKSLDSFYIANSANVFDNVGSYISNFSNNTSDHYPVYGSYNWKMLTAKTDTLTTDVNNNTPNNQVAIFPNPVVDFLNVFFAEPISEIIITDITGKQYLMPYNAATGVNLSAFKSGLYNISIKSNMGIYYKKFIKQ